MIRTGVLDELTKTAQRRRLIIDKLLEKFEKAPPTEISYNVFEMPDDIHNSSTVSEASKSVSVQNLTQREHNLLDNIENNLKSNLKTLILEREKSKILYDYETFNRMHIETKTELAKLLKSISRSDISEYIGLCTVVSEDVINYIEGVLKSRFKEALIKQLDLAKKKMYNNAILVEWHYLIKLVAEEDVIKYAVHVLKNYY